MYSSIGKTAERACDDSLGDALIPESWTATPSCSINTREANVWLNSWESINHSYPDTKRVSGDWM